MLTLLLTAHPIAPGGNTNEDKGLELAPPKDDDADGTKLLQASDGLDRAAKFLSPLSTLTKDNIDAWIAIYDVAVRRSKYDRLRCGHLYLRRIVREIPTSCAGSEPSKGTGR